MYTPYRTLKPGDYWQYVGRGDTVTYIVTGDVDLATGMHYSRAVEEQSNRSKRNDDVIAPAHWIVVIQVGTPSPIRRGDTVRFIKPLEDSKWSISSEMEDASKNMDHLEATDVSAESCVVRGEANSWLIEPENLVKIADNEEPEMQNDDMITLNLTREQACALFVVTGSITGDTLFSPRKLTSDIFLMLESMGFSESCDEVKEMRSLSNHKNIHFEKWPKKVDPWKEAECRADDLVPGDLFRIMFDGQTKVVLNSVDMWGSFQVGQCSNWIYQQKWDECRRNCIS